MTVDWMALLTVGIVAVAATAIFASVLALSIRLRYPRRGTPKTAENSRPAILAGRALLVVIGAMIAVGLWLIIPHFS